MIRSSDFGRRTSVSGPHALAFAAALAVLAFAGQADAAPLADVARAQIDATLPAHLAVAELHLARALAGLDVDPSTVTVSWPRAPKVGTASVKLAWGGRTRLVPVTVAALVPVPVAVRELAAGESIMPDDIVMEDRPLAAGVQPAALTIGQTVTTAIAAGAVVTAGAVTRPTPVPRGTAVTLEVRRGNVRVTTAGTLERAARPGEEALVRISRDRAPLRGTLVAADLVVIGDQP